MIPEPGLSQFSNLCVQCMKKAVLAFELLSGFFVILFICCRCLLDFYISLWLSLHVRQTRTFLLYWALFNYSVFITRYTMPCFLIYVGLWLCILALFWNVLQMLLYCTIKDNGWFTHWIIHTGLYFYNNSFNQTALWIDLNS